MAGSSVIGALRVVLGADTAALEKGLKDSRSALAAFGKQVTTIAAGIGLEKAIESSVGALVHAIKQGVTEADKLNKLSQSIGIPVEELSKLKYAADLSDVSLESLGKSAGKLAKAMVEVAGGGAGPAAQAFTALGISVRNQDGTLKSSSEALADIAEKFAGYKDGAAKTALAIAIFGKAGADMIPLLNMGRDGLKEAGDEAAQLGLVLDKNTSQAAENFNDNLTRLGKVKDGIITQITARMLPSLEAFSGQMVQSAKDADFLQKSADGITNVLKFMAAEVLEVVTRFQRLGVETMALWEVLKAPDWPSLKAAWSNYTAEAQKSEQVFASLKTTIANIWSDAPSWESQAMGIAAMNKQVMLLAAEWTKTAPPIIAAGAATKNAFDTFISSQQKSLAAQQAEFDATGMAIGAKERLKVVLQGLAAAQANGIILTDAQKIKLTEAANAAELMALKLGNLRLIGETNPFELIGLQIDAINAKLQSGALSANDYAVLSGQAAQLTAKLWADSATSLGGSFESIGSSMGQMNESWARFAKIGQAIGAAIAFVNAYVAASQAFATTPFPGNIAIAAGVLAKGIAMVAAIKGAAAPKMAMGGAFRVPGGFGGGDKVPFNAMLEPGELVEVTSNRSDGYKSGGRGGQSSSGGTYTLQVPDFLRPFAEALMPHIEAANRDGHTLKLATI